MIRTPENLDSELLASNYCVSFIDLLGQRIALQGQGLLPQSEDERKKFDAALNESVGAITKLQSQSEAMLQGILNPKLETSVQATLTIEQQATWDEIRLAKVKTQRWSDGLVSFVCLSDKEVKCSMNSVFGLLGLAGTLCLLGLASRCPVRGAIEVAWGVELHASELYGAAVARAYELESEVAQYPRIVVGPETVRLLQVNHANPAQDLYSKHNRELAKICLGMLAQDVDGYWFVHYLGEEFQRSISHSHHAKLYKKALIFVHDQLFEHQASFNSKLAFRYSHLLRYFDDHPASTSKEV